MIRRLVGFVTTGYAILYASMNGWLRGFYGPETRSFASAFVCGIIALNLWNIFQLINRELAFSLVADRRNILYVALIMVFAAIDLAIVKTGKADRWAGAVKEKYVVLWRFRNELLVALIVLGIAVLVW